MKTAEEVVQKLIEMTRRDQLGWHEVDAMGELAGYMVERRSNTFMLEHRGDGVLALRVNGTEIEQGSVSLTQLNHCIHVYLCELSARGQVSQREGAIRKAVTALQ